MPHKLDNPQENIVTPELKNGAVVLSCEHPMGVEFVKALTGTLDEWSSANNEDAYRNLLASALQKNNTFFPGNEKPDVFID